jgi:hypothetical protein
VCVAGLHRASQGCRETGPRAWCTDPASPSHLRFAKDDPFFNSSRVTFTPLQPPMYASAHGSFVRQRLACSIARFGTFLHVPPLTPPRWRRLALCDRAGPRARTVMTLGPNGHPLA